MKKYYRRDREYDYGWNGFCKKKGFDKEAVVTIEHIGMNIVVKTLNGIVVNSVDKNGRNDWEWSKDFFTEIDEVEVLLINKMEKRKCQS